MAPHRPLPPLKIVAFQSQKEPQLKWVRKLVYVLWAMIFVALIAAAADGHRFCQQSPRECAGLLERAKSLLWEKPQPRQRGP